MTAAFESVSLVCCYNPVSICQNAGHWAQEVSDQTLINPVHVTYGGWWEATVTITNTIYIFNVHVKHYKYQNYNEFSHHTNAL